MAWLAVDGDDEEIIYFTRPERREDFWMAREEKDIPETYRYMISLPHGSIKKLIGRELKWEDNPVELREDSV